MTRRMHKLAVVVLLVGGAGVAGAGGKKPRLLFGTPTVTGSLDEKPVATVMKRSSSKLLACFKKSLAVDGAVTATFLIEANGKVSGVAVRDQPIPKVETCLVDTISKLRFAKPKDGDVVDVTFPLVYEAGATAGILGTMQTTEGGAFASLTGTGDISSGFDDTNIYGGLLGNEAGSGAGGGGTGWGTIGTGRYGTIGGGTAGSGYGVGGGRGGMRGRSNAVPTVSIGQPNSQGDLDKAIIRRYVKRNIQKIQYCYEKELLTKKTLKGTLTAEFTISPNGNVTSSTASGLDSNVDTCVANVIKAIEFPKPHGGGSVTVKYPFTFRPADEPPPAPKKKK